MAEKFLTIGCLSVVLQLPAAQCGPLAASVPAFRLLPAVELAF